MTVYTKFKVIIALLGVSLVLVVGFTLAPKFLPQKSTQNQNDKAENGLIEGVKGERLFVDLNGDGNKDYIVLTLPDNVLDLNLEAMVAYDSSDKEIGRFPQELPLLVPFEDSFKTYRLISDYTEEAFSFDFIAGPHQSETMFFELLGDKILPICLNEEVKSAYDCLFYSGNVSYLPAKDLDSDGYIEVIEVVDEYPTDGELSSKENEAIDKAFEEQGVNEFTEGAERIARREKGGRGRTVVWAIYSYNGEFFEPQTGSNYTKYYNLLGDLIQNKMKKSELSKDSLDYINFAREFWSKR